MVPELTVELRDVQECRYLDLVNHLLVISILLPSIVDPGFSTLRNSSAFELLAYLAIGMICFEIPLLLLCPYRRMSSLGTLPLMFFLSVCLLWSPAGYAVKTLTFPPQKFPVSYVFFRSVAHYFPVYGIISWCPMCRLLKTSDSANFLLEIQATRTSMSITFTYGMCTQNLKLWEWNLRPSFVTEFVDPVENAGILRKNCWIVSFFNIFFNFFNKQ